ncbi:hypothetical protein C1646_711585 [Rhizophagus diaphanus]|nr:hypothetical protein C1646_711585 [Rhizophagus diaphanus] [Rhizophagus sp. MUCL 43196]
MTEFAVIKKSQENGFVDFCSSYYKSLCVVNYLTSFYFRQFIILLKMSEWPLAMGSANR